MHTLLLQSVKYLKGVGPARAKILSEEMKISSLRDLLFTFPSKYIDRSHIHRIRDLQEDMPYVQLKGQLLDFNEEGAGRKRRIQGVFTDGTGYVELVWFAGLKYVRENIKVNRTYLLLGKPTVYGGRFSFSHPELDPIPTTGNEPPCRIQPVYSLSERVKKCGLSSRAFATLVRHALEALGEVPIEETLPEHLRVTHHLLPLDAAVKTAHFPAASTDVPIALRRLKFEELFFLQLDILRYSRNRRLKLHGFVFPRIGRYFMRFYDERLPFRLTEAQKRVLREIRKDLGSGRQMNRLLQGDVGSGKTMVALMVCLMALDNGFQTCLMAPTEILAEQHATTIAGLLGDLPIRVELLTGMVKGRRRREILQGTADGSIQLLIGTHALIEPTVCFRNLGLCVIDEQHRFGVKQRAELWKKNAEPPHILVMTATPIPRTLAMTVYGDLDVSVIDELPPGRKPIRTLHYYENNTVHLFESIRRQLASGRQAYVVFPLISESEKIDLQDLEQGFENLKAAFPEYQVGKVHGRMKSDEKEREMRYFIQGETQLLVSTTVIEVGVNVPNASVMVIQNAERFGLAQLHQLRGRVGRGADQSYCILVTKRELSSDTRRRMQIMVESNDGFEIAEEDLKLRGPGDLEGTMQSGMPFDLKVANIVRDSLLMQTARDAAVKILEQDPTETLPQHQMLWRELQRIKKDKINFSSIS